MTEEKERQLRLAAANAESRLRALAQQFNSPNFTDRYLDGPACESVANQLKEALK